MAADTFQEQMVAARRAQILDAATKVFAEKGFQRATIRDVAKAAGIADGTIYNYFENKTALMLGLMDRLNETERREEDIAQIGEMELRQFVEGYLRQRHALMTQEGMELFQVILAEVLVNPELRALYMGQIVEPTFALAEKYGTKLVEDGQVRPMDVPLLMRATSALSLGLLMLRILGDPVAENRWDELPEFLSTMILHGISPSEGGDQ